MARRVQVGDPRYMAGMRDDEATNDVEFEVSRLDDDATAHPAEPAEVAPPGASRIAQENNLRLHASRRLLQASVTSLAVALAVAIILVTFPNAANQLKAPLRLLTPAPTPTVPPGSDIILLAHTVPWGELHLERPDLHPLYLGYRERYPAYRLPPGRHTLFYVAAPFSPMQCKLSVPRRSDDDCTLATSRNGIANDPDASTRLIDAEASVKQLDFGERHELQTLLETGIAYPQLTIEPGTHYLDQSGKVAVADERLKVTMAMGAVAAPAKAVIVDDDMQLCKEICNLDSAQDYLTWKLTIWAAPHWTYVTATGSAFSTYGAPAQEQDVASVFWRDGNWILDTQNGLGAPCDFRVFIEILSEKSGDAGLDTFTQYGGNSPVVANPANGCVLEFHAQENPGGHPRPEVLYRLGVLLATNADAQRIFPDLPVASVAERDIAQAIRAGAVQ
jgi:hypothetical protein